MSENDEKIKNHQNDPEILKLTQRMKIWTIFSKMFKNRGKC